MINQNTVLGWGLLVAGIGVVVFSLWNLIFRLFFAYLGYMLINYALRLLGKPPVQWWIMQMFLPFGRF